VCAILALRRLSRRTLKFEAPNQMIAKHEKRRLVRAAAVIG
jgi:hypothetical protein